MTLYRLRAIKLVKDNAFNAMKLADQELEKCFERERAASCPLVCERGWRLSARGSRVLRSSVCCWRSVQRHVLESFELSIVQIGPHTTEIQRRKRGLGGRRTRGGGPDLRRPRRSTAHSTLSRLADLLVRGGLESRIED